ncbi:MAG: hypothetical protein V2I24_16840 [Halieaceae bacterium]|jgi:hypothetical protein|nr:hypothetical protein [Halieaceae bacterium]
MRFLYEGTFRQALITKGHNRDTAWFSILDHEWSAIRTRFENWLAPSNFDSEGRQMTRLQTREDRLQDASAGAG